MPRSCSIASAPIRDDGTSVTPAERSSASIASAAAFGGAVGDRPTGQRLAQPGHEPLAIELLARAVALDDDQPGRLDALVGGEPERAGGALPAAPDRGRIIEVARVDDAGLPLAALGAAHGSPARLTPQGLVVCREDTTRWCGRMAPIRRQTSLRSDGRFVDPQVVRPDGVPGDRLAGVDEVQVAALDRGLGLELAAAPPRRRQHVGAVFDHAERPARPLELGDEVVADRLRPAGRLERARLLADSARAPRSRPRRSG